MATNPTFIRGPRWEIHPPSARGKQGHAMGLGAAGVIPSVPVDITRYTQPLPGTLGDIPDAPACLFGIGSLEALEPGLAIVGARKATPYGLECAEHFAYKAAQLGITVISGGAIGCDQAAHRGALAAGGRTTVVLGGGADVIYPKRGASLFQEAVDKGGALVSEQPWGAEPLAWTFPLRNRIISGLSKAVLVVEAGMPSGTFKTADDALDQGREVLVVPGSIFSKDSRGSNHLLLQGALPIVDDESFEEILLLLFGTMQLKLSGETPLDERLLVLCKKRGLDEYRDVLRTLIAQPRRPEELLGSAGKSIPEVLQALSRLEAASLITCYPDGRYGARATRG